MPYSITTYAGQALATVQDATINTTSTALTLIGRDYAGYGAFLNENFVYLLENFAGNTAPQQKLTGQIWYDTSVNTLKVWNSSAAQWKPIGSSIALDTKPSGAVLGDLWFDTTNYQLYVYTNELTIGDAGWQLIGPPSTSTAGTKSGAVVETIEDSSGNQHVVIKFYISDNTVGIVSFDDTFTPKNSIQGFTEINPGFNLAAATSLPNGRYTGDASNALKLNGISSAQFLRSDQDSNSPYLLTVGNLSVGGSFNVTQLLGASEVKITTAVNGYNTNFYSNVGGSVSRTIGVNGTTGAVTVDKSLKVSQNAQVIGTLTANGAVTLADITTLQNKLLPNQTNTIDIGATNRRFSTVWAGTFVGNVIGNVTANAVSIGNVTITQDNISIFGNSVANQSYVTYQISKPGYNSQGKKIISTSPPSGNADNGDIWYQI